MATMEKLKIFVILLTGIFIINPVLAQKKVEVKVTDLQYAGNKVIISYDIVNYDKNDRFVVWVDVFYANDSLCKEAQTFEGDIGTKIKGGKDKLITWDLKSDNVFIDETINIEVMAKYMESDLGVGTAVLYSTIYPGLGNYKLSRKKSYLAIGAAAYTFLGISIIYNNKYRKNFDEYLASTDINESDDLYRKSKNQKLASKIFGYTALGIWITDIIITAKQAKEKRAEKSVSLNQKRLNYFFTYDPLIKGPSVYFSFKF